MRLAKLKEDGSKALLRPWSLDPGLGQMFDNFLDFSKDWEFPIRGGELFPTVDITETAKEYSIHAEIPGMRKEDTKISIANNLLTLSGEKKSEIKKEDKKLHRMESYYGSFQRSFVLPGSIRADKVTANFKDGVLTITIPKSEEALEKNVDINIS